jgi:hypothetical protein
MFHLDQLLSTLTTETRGLRRSYDTFAACNMEGSINVLVDTFPGLGLAQTVCLPFPASTSSEELLHDISNILPGGLIRSHRLILTTTSNKQLHPSKDVKITEFLDDDASRLLPVCLSVPICGGKGGFGSQLRAAGGRMSSRKRRQNAELATGSARNLDGRRLRTITEAKNLAAYLATKPDMDRKEKEERRKRWEQVVDLAEQREADMRAGKGPDGRRKGLSDEWIETKEDVGENVRNAVKIAMSAAEEQNSSSDQDGKGSPGNSSADSDDEDGDMMEMDEEGMSKLRAEAEAGDADAIWVLKHQLKIPKKYLPASKPKRRFAGFDDVDGSLNSEDESDGEDASIKTAPIPA